MWAFLACLLFEGKGARKGKGAQCTGSLESRVATCWHGSLEDMEGVKVGAG